MRAFEHGVENDRNQDKRTGEELIAQVTQILAEVEEK
jgi:hypothetical protein